MFCCLLPNKIRHVAMKKKINSRLVNSVDSGQPCHIPNIYGTSSKFSPYRMVWLWVCYI